MGGSLDVLKETWEASGNNSDASVVSYILSVQEKMERMTELVKENSVKAKAQQKTWYDRNARSREFQPGDQVLVLLPTSTSKLLAQWQGPYPVIRSVGSVNYQIDMVGKRKRKRIFHVNMEHSNQHGFLGQGGRKSRGSTRGGGCGVVERWR